MSSVVLGLAIGSAHVQLAFRLSVKPSAFTADSLTLVLHLPVLTTVSWLSGFLYFLISIRINFVDKYVDAYKGPALWLFLCSECNRIDNRQQHIYIYMSSGAECEDAGIWNK